MRKLGFLGSKRWIRTCGSSVSLSTWLLTRSQSRKCWLFGIKMDLTWDEWIIYISVHSPSCTLRSPTQAHTHVHAHAHMHTHTDTDTNTHTHTQAQCNLHNSWLGHTVVVWMACYPSMLIKICKICYSHPYTHTNTQTYQPSLSPDIHWNTPFTKMISPVPLSLSHYLSISL